MNLMRDGRFWPLFWTQFFGAFNDNVFKNALVLLITFKAYKLGAVSPEQMVALSGGIFILPFFLFSATAGQICDKFPKHKLIFLIKIWEIIVMVVGALGFYLGSIETLLSTLFFMGLQSTFFGPIKYSILPELLKEDELVKGNALVASGTFISILLGTILGGAFIGLESWAGETTGVAVIIFAGIGTFFGSRVKPLKAANENLKIEWGLIKPTWQIVKVTRNIKSVFLAVLGISWFWFLGAALLSMFPTYGKNVLGTNSDVVTLFLAMFSIGVGVGSQVCEKLSHKQVELGLVPFGTVGISLFVIDLYFVGEPNLGLSNIGIEEFLKYPVHWRILIDLFMLSVFSGFFIVPLYTFIQSRSQEGERSQVIAGLNIINALFMVSSAIVLTLLYGIGLSVPEIFGVWGILNLMVAFYIYTVIPEYLMRFLAMILTWFVYRLKVKGLDNIPENEGCIIVCNHVSFVDWLIVSAGVRRPMRFVMWYKFMQLPLIGFLFRDAKVIPIASKKENPEILDQAYDEISRALAAGEVICLFPEGEITHDGKLNNFKPGIERILKRNPVPVIPMVLTGLWGSFFSRAHGGKALSKPSVILKRLFSRVHLDIYAPWSPKIVKANDLEDFYRKKLDN